MLVHASWQGRLVRRVAVALALTLPASVQASGAAVARRPGGLDLVPPRVEAAANGGLDPVPPAALAPPPEPSPGWSVAGWSAIGTGSAVALGAIVPALAAARARDDARGLRDADGRLAPSRLAEDRRLALDAASYDRTATALVAVGASLLVGGAAVLFFAPERDDSRAPEPVSGNAPAMGPRAAPAAGDWAIVGLKEAAGEPIEPLVALARGNLARELGAPERVLGPEELRVRLDLPPAELAGARERLAAAELHYFQLELESARRSVTKAIELLVRLGGEREAWERLQVARLLLASIDLAVGTPAARERARDDLMPLVRVRQDVRPAAGAYPDELIAAFDEAVARAATLPRGTLLVRCRTACPGARVWIDGAPAGAADSPVPLPVGRYQVVVTDSPERTGRRSGPFEVEVKTGGEAVVEAEFASDDTLDSPDGPALLVSPEGRNALLTRVARESAAERLVALWRSDSPDGARLHLAVIATPGGQVERHAQIRGDAASERIAVEKLVRFAVSGEREEGVEDVPLSPLEPPMPSHDSGREAPIR